MEPRPIEEIAPERLRGLRSIIFDVDDTVTDGGRLCPQAFQAMHLMSEAGLSLVAATGRPLGWARVIFQHWPLEAAIGENGAGWFYNDSGGVAVQYAAEPKERNEHQEKLRALWERVSREMPDVQRSEDSDLRRCDLAFDIGEKVRLPQERRALLRKLIESEALGVTESSVHMHAIPGSWDKATAIRRVLSEVLETSFGTHKDSLAYVGDSPNDAPAFALIPLSVGVRNVLESSPLPSPMPAFITSASRGRGFSELARLVLQAR